MEINAQEQVEKQPHKSLSTSTQEEKEKEHQQVQPKVIKYDEALTQIGGQGRYQWVLALNLGIQWVLMSMVFMSATFWLQPPEFICKDGSTCFQDDAKDQGRCSKQFLAPTNGRTTITLDTGMYCDNSHLLLWAQSIVFIGSAAGTFFIPQLSDMFGRKYPIFILQLVAGLSLFIISLTKDKVVFMIFYFIFGFAVWPCETIIFAMLCECINGKLRGVALIGCYLFWSVGSIVMAGVAYGIEEWNKGMLYTIALPYLGFSAHAIKLLNRMARFNGKPLIEENILLIGDEQEVELALKEFNHKQGNKNEEIKVPEKKYSIIDLFRYKSLLKITVTSSLVITGVSILYFGSSLALATLSSDVYISVVVVGACEIGSNIACAFFLHLLPRRKGMIIFYAITILISLSFIFFKYSENADDVSKIQKDFQIALSGIMRIFNVFCTGIFGLYCQEVFPTPVRTIGTGFAFSFSTLLTFIAPFLIEQATKMNVYGTFVLGLAGLVFFIPSFFFEETLGKPVKECIQELNVIKPTEIITEKK